ncbi:MAG: hypothetical protein ABJN84_15710 [Flavobacteriaceae bacterium]
MLNTINLAELFEYHNLHSEKLLSKATMRYYGTTQKYLLDYVKSTYRRNDFRLKNLHHSFVVGFEKSKNDLSSTNPKILKPSAIPQRPNAD